MRNLKLLIPLLFILTNSISSYCQANSNDATHYFIKTGIDRNGVNSKMNCIINGGAFMLGVTRNVQYDPEHDCDINIVVVIPSDQSYDSYDDLIQSNILVDQNIQLDDLPLGTNVPIRFDIGRALDCNRIAHLDVLIYCGNSLEESLNMALCCNDDILGFDQEIGLSQRSQKVKEDSSVNSSYFAVYNLIGQKICSFYDKSALSLNELSRSFNSQMVIVVESNKHRVISIEKYFIHND